MASNNNVFYASNPARMSDALWQIMGAGADDVRDMLIFLPSRRAVRTVEKMIVQKMGGACYLPTLVALGEGPDDPELMDMEFPDTVSNMERVVTLAKLLTGNAHIGTLSVALPIAADLVRMWDYMENEGINPADVSWTSLIDENKFAQHRNNDALTLNILSEYMPKIFNGRETVSNVRNREVRAWIGGLDKYSRVIVCASTASVPATADLMVAVAKSENGRIILSGKISGRECDFELDTNPYNAEYKLLKRIGITPSDVLPIDVGASAIDFLGAAFGNDGALPAGGDAVSHCHLVECDRESEEASVVAEIAARAVAENKSVLVITPDAAGNQRIRAALSARNIAADFSSGTSGTMMATGRALLNVFDDWIDSGDKSTFDNLFMASNFDLKDTLVRMVDDGVIKFSPLIDVTDKEYEKQIPIWNAIEELSDIVKRADIKPDMADVRALLAYAIGTVTVRSSAPDNAAVCVLGTIESRMQTADVVILTGLNDGMFPALGYENAWLPLAVSKEIGLPSPNRKVSLQSLDFMNLSCGECVYWLRSRVSGGVQTTESRFLSRVRARHGQFDNPRKLDADGKTEIDNTESVGYDLVCAVRAIDCIKKSDAWDNVSFPKCAWDSAYVTGLDKLRENPYVFYVNNILNIYPEPDEWDPQYQIIFGNLVHKVLQEAKTPDDFTVENLMEKLNAKMGCDEFKIDNGIIAECWRRRFPEIAEVIHAAFVGRDDMGMAEFRGAADITVPIDGGFKTCTIRAKADRIWDGIVMDCKTGTPPDEKDMKDGKSLQLPITAYIMKNGGFNIQQSVASQTPCIEVLGLKRGAAELVSYDSESVSMMMDAAYNTVAEFIASYATGMREYKYDRNIKNHFYGIYNDLARVDD